MIDWSLIDECTVVQCANKSEVADLAREVLKAYPEKEINPDSFVRWFGEYPVVGYNLRLNQNRVTYGSVEFYLEEGYKVIRYSDLIGSLKEFGEISGEEMSIEFLFGALEVAE